MLLVPTTTDRTGDAARPAITIDGESIGRDQLYAASAAVAAQVAERVDRTSPVAIHATPSIRTVIGFLGCLQAGVPAVPVPPDAGTRERQHILTDSGARLWLGDRLDDLSDSLPTLVVDPTATGPLRTSRTRTVRR
jgi:fatty acid CoA ligase FadD36